MRVILVVAAAVTLVAFGEARGEPVETRSPNGRDQKPAFSGQTRAPKPEKASQVQTEKVASGLDHPWALEFLPDGRMLVTEKKGQLRIVDAKGQLSKPVSGLPKVVDDGQGGLLDVALDPNHSSNGLIYWSYSEPRKGGNGTAVARGRLVTQGQPRVEKVQVIFRQQPTFESDKHFGSRLVFTPDGMLFIVLGERSLPESRVKSQDLGTHFGKVIRINPDGSVPKDNPFVGRAGAQPEIWSYGHRNIQSAALDSQGRLWTVEHGPKGGDELNRPQPGKNYGWPVITYGIDYSGKPIGQGITAQEGMEQPLYYWDPVIGPSGMAFYSGDRFPEWRGNMLLGGLVSEGIVRLVLDGDRVASEEWIPLDARIRDVKVGPDGAVYAITDEGDGRILRVLPAQGK
ncbi:PQQ-dependent sugar dehydrogenase [Hyalangium rubrum]|uniref:PQQ-dependent sugar dehydrogenase n=1 Tax=Hyalangium rubrum TaxID=3103134 RepID=A0ABU5HBG5_9BACT|nr:PQQ-dependent sugar dehydrogenase [Hyalangium sp. s54d21]MDY7229450.1 PQQ-dependent sugar dehydrogenase [Hyalangium sp. s54d21]